MTTIATKAMLAAAMGGLAMLSGTAVAKTRAGDNPAIYSTAPDRSAPAGPRETIKNTKSVGTQLAFGALAVVAVAGGIMAVSGGGRSAVAPPRPALPPVSPGT